MVVGAAHGPPKLRRLPHGGCTAHVTHGTAMPPLYSHSPTVLPMSPTVLPCPHCTACRSCGTQMLTAME